MPVECTQPPYQEHPLRPLLKTNGITVKGVAKGYLNLSYKYVNNILAGKVTTTPEVEKKLQELIRALEN